MLRSPIAILYVAVAILATTGCADRREQSDAEELLSRAVRVVEDERPVRARFTDVASHRECGVDEAKTPPPMRCRPLDRQTLERLARIAAELRRQDRDGDPRLARAETLLALFRETGDGLDPSVERLSAALRRHGRSAELLNDLAALLLVRAELRDAPADAVSALRHAEEALRLRSSFPEAETNRALALETLTLWSAAAAGWQRAEEGAGDSGWRTEAQAGRRRCALRARPAPEASLAATGRNPVAPDARLLADPHTLRRETERRLGDWAQGSAAGHTVDAETALAAASRLADRLSRRTGDRLYLETVERIRRAERGSAGELRALVEGHAAFAVARGGDLYSDCAGAALAAAERALESAGSPFAGWALLDGAICAYFAKDFALAEARLETIRRRTTGRAYPTLEGRRAWILALVRMVQGRYDEAVASLRTAIDRFERVGEDEHVIYLQSLMAETYRQVGAHELAWRFRLRALAGRGRISSAERTFTILEEAVEALTAEGAEPESLYFLAEQLAAAERAVRDDDWDLVVYTLIDRREALLALGRKAEADVDLAQAEGAWARLPAGHESRRRLRLELDVHRATADGDDEALLTAIRQGLAFFQRGEVDGDRIQVMALHRAAAGVHLRRGDLQQTERALLASLAEAETQRARLMSPEHRASFLDEMRELNDRLAEIQLDRRGDPWRALEFVERASNRVLLDLLDPSSRQADGAAGAPWSQLAERPIPPRTVVVRFGRVGDRLLVWTLSGNRRAFEERDAPRQLLADRLASIHRLLGDRRAEPLLDVLLTELGDRLLPDAVHRLPAGTHLVFVPDDSTAGVPFAALRDPAGGGGYLGERFPISVAPSLLVYRRAVERGAAWRAPAGHEVLLAADPRFDGGLFPAMSELAHARRAGESLRRIYPGATLLAGPAATEGRLAAAFPTHRIFHFEGHAVSDPTNGARSALLLAPEDPARPDRESSLLRAEELLHHDLGHLRLIVLAACSTAVGLYPESREVASLATSFLAAGAPAVVASLWDVEDAATAALFAELHRRLAAGSPPAVALQEAQESLRKSGDARLAHPAAWAGFAVFGGGG